MVSLTYRDQNYPDWIRIIDQIQIKDLYYGSGLQIRIHGWLKIDQDLPYSNMDNFSHDKIKNTNSALWLWIYVWTLEWYVFVD